MKKSTAIIFTVALILAGCSNNAISDALKESAEVPVETVADEETEAAQESMEVSAEKSPVTVEDAVEEQNHTADNGDILLYSWYQGPKVTVKNNEVATKAIQDELDLLKTDFKTSETEYLQWATDDHAARVAEAETAAAGVDSSDADAIGTDTTDMESSVYAWNAYYSMSHYYEVTRNDGKVLSLKLSDDSYLGGAHGSRLYTGANFDPKTGEKLTTDNISDDPEALKTACKEEIIRQCAEMPAEMFFNDPSSKEFADTIEGIVAGNAWYFTNSGIKFIANEYEIAAYAAGSFSFTVPYDMLTVLKTGYAYDGGYIREVPSGCSVTADLDGDGTEDTLKVVYNVDYENDVTNIELTINGQDYSDQIAACNIYFSDGMTDSYAITDLDEKDGYKEIAIMDNGPSDDPVTYFFRFDGTKLTLLGNIVNLITSPDSKINGDGTFTANMRISVLETAYTTATYEINAENQIALVPQDWYDIKQYSGEDTDHVHNILQNVQVYREQDQNSDSVILTPEDGTVMFPRTDNIHWVEVETSSGKLYYMYVEDFGTVISEGKQLNLPEVFDNIFLAD